MRLPISLRLFIISLRLFIVVFASAFVHDGAAQYNEKDFTRYSVKDGLSDNRIICLQQDDQGYMWIGTETGLNRFDGATFEKYYQGSTPLNLPSGFITRLKRYGQHRLGIFTRGGFEVLDTKTYQAQRYTIQDSTAFTTQLNSVWDALPLPDGSFALSTAAGFYIVDKKSGILLRHDAYNIHDIGRKRILYGRDIFTADNGQYLVYVNEDGQAIYNQRTKKFYELVGTEPEWKPYIHPRRKANDRWISKRQLNNNEVLFIPYRTDSIIYYNRAWNKTIASYLPFDATKELYWASGIEPVNDSVFLISSVNTGFYRLTLDRRTGHVYCDGKKFLPSYEIISLFTDKDGRLWAGTSEGLLKQELTPRTISAYQYKYEVTANGSGFFSCAYRYGDVLYAGHYARNGGLFLMDAGSMKVKREVRFYGSDSQWNEVISIEMYHRDTLWIGTWAGILWYDVKSGRYGKVLDANRYPWAADFHAVLAPPRGDGYAWLCSVLDGKLLRYHIPSHSFTLFTSETNPALPFDKLKNIAYDSYGDVWIGGHALARWNNRSQNFDTVIKVYSGPNKYNEDIVAFTADKKGSLWIHNADNGLLEYRIAEKKFVAYGMQNGLPSNALQSLSPVVDGKLWIAGHNQLCLLNTATRQFTVYDHNDGLPERIPTGRRIYYDTIGKRLYLCSKDYLVSFPLTPEEKHDNSSPLLLEEIQVDNERSIYAPEDAIKAGYSENNLRFNFTIIDFEKANYLFAYRLNDGAWNSIGTQRSINFNKLAPGDYSLEIKASGKPGVEKTKKVFFTVRPPFWQTTWFIIFISILAIAAVYFVFLVRVRGVRKKAELDRLLSQTEMKALQAQMNPHFIFNSLNSIREMILNNENKDASHYLSKFAHLIRMTLDQSAKAQVSLRNTIDYLNRYMEMETIRNSLFTYQTVVDDKLDVDETFVSPMLIQPFIENAIWHGVTANRKDIHVRIDFKKEAETLVCVIDDNGVGITQSLTGKTLNDSLHHSHGISNIKNRIKLLNEKYSLCCGLQIGDKKETSGNGESGTIVTLQLPLEIQDHE